MNARPPSTRFVKFPSEGDDLDLSHIDNDNDNGRNNTPAKHIEGRVGMLRSKKLGRVLNHTRNGVLVINLADGGSLLFYKVFKSSSNELKSKQCLEDSIRSGEGAESVEEDVIHESIHNRDLSKIDSTRRNSLDDIILSQIENVSVYVSYKEFVVPPDPPYLDIPSSVPWKFKSVQSYKNNSFQIVVPPLPDGSIDPRVKIFKYSDKIKKIIHRASEITNNQQGTTSVQNFVPEAPSLDRRNAMHSTSANKSSTKQPSKNFQTFGFACKYPKEMAVYARAAQKLGRLSVDNNYAAKSIMLKSVNRRVRNAEGMEIAAQAAMIDKRRESMGRKPARRLSSIGDEEFRCYPLHAYPYCWMTRKELVEEVSKTSGTFHDLTKGSSDELGTMKIEILQCNGIPKMDRNGLSDATVYVVCGSEAFISDTIDHNLNPFWLPLTRRACILPIKAAYHQVHVGVFDYDGEYETDDFIGKVVLDIAQFQPGFTYDFTLPLRQTTRVYQRLQLGSIRLRVQLNWKYGERSALLSYLPKSGSDIAKRLKHRPEPITVICPDLKSFRNVAYTVYGSDIPGKTNPKIRNAASRELALVKKTSMHLMKTAVNDIVYWKNPLMSAYVLCSWMYFVYDESMRHVPAFLLSLLFILLLRNYVKFYVASEAGSMYGHRTILGMCSVLLFNSGNFGDLSRLRRRNNRSLSERLLMWLFGRSGTSGNGKDSWNQEDHLEFPFSKGSVYPKMSVWDAMNPSAPKPQDHLLQPLSKKDDALNWEDDVDSEFSDNENSEKEISGNDDDDDEMAARILMKNQFSSMSNIKAKFSYSKEFQSKRQINAAADDSSTESSQLDGADSPTLKIPNQDIRVKLKKTKSIQEELHDVYRKIHRYNFHLFDDRVYEGISEKDANKVLEINRSNNPIMKKLFPMMTVAINILYVELSASRSIFNLLTWKDPMLSFWAISIVFFSMMILLLFPWRPFFFIVGLITFGPQNWLVMKFRSWRKKPRNQLHPVPTNAKNASLSKSDIKKALKSPLLFRNNTQMKSDGKMCQVIIPASPFRSNRFYDFPPAPELTKIY